MIGKLLHHFADENLKNWLRAIVIYVAKMEAQDEHAWRIRAMALDALKGKPAPEPEEIET